MKCKRGDFIKNKKGYWIGVVIKVDPSNFETSGGYFVIRLDDGKEIELSDDEFVIENEI